MFNENLKRQYILDEIPKGNATLRAERLFNLAEKYEIEWNADICTKNAEELADAVEAIVGVRSGSQATHLSELRRYAKWCIENNVPGACDGLLKVQKIGLKKIKQYMVSDPDQLQMYMDIAFPPETDGRFDNIYRGFFWMAYAGLPEPDTVMITADHVDLKNLVIRYDGKEYPIYQQAVYAIRNLCLSGAFVCDYVRYEKIMPRTPGNQILRGVKADSQTKADTIRRLALRRMDVAFAKAGEDVSLNYRTLWLSGVFHRIYETESRTGKCDFSEYINVYFENRADVTDKRKATALNEVRNDYIRWKEAFNK